MHSRIYQLSEKPITKDKLKQEYEYEDIFVGSIADYVAEIPFKSNEYLEDLKWLSTLKGIEVNAGAGTLIIKSKKEYFTEKYNGFKELLAKLSNVTLDEFITTNSWSDMYELNATYEDKHSFYADDNDEYYEPVPFDNWIRTAEENKIYYIGSIIDYHF